MKSVFLIGGLALVLAACGSNQVSNQIAPNESSSVSVQATAGSLDSSFGTNGVTITSFTPYDDIAADFAFDSSGKIIVGGTTRASSSSNTTGALARYNPNGSLDTSFGTGGKVVLPPYAVETNSTVTKVLFDSSGRLITLSNNKSLSSTISIMRFNANGSFDSTFGTGGIVKPSPVYVNKAIDAAIDASNRLLVLMDNLTVARFNPDGSRDTSFGTGSFATATVPAVTGSSGQYSTSLTLDASGRILVSGSVYYPKGNPDFVVGRLTPDGLVDSAFGTNGSTAINVGSANSYDVSPLVNVDGSGNVVLTGQTPSPTQTTTQDFDIGLVRLNPDGSLDLSFGNGGKAIIAITSKTDTPTSSAIDTSGRIVLSGIANRPSGNLGDFMVARVNSNGTPDTGFGTNGVVITALTVNQDWANKVGIDSNGKILAVGFKANFSIYDPTTDKNFALVRYTP